MGRIENLLKMPWEYNFEFECGDNDYAQLDTFERYFTYKTARQECDYEGTKKFINEHSNYIDIYDPDGSGYKYYPLTHKIYEKLWGWKRSNRTFGVCKGMFNDNLFGGDTMNSVQTVLGWIAGKNNNGRYSVYWTLNCWCTDIMLEEQWKEMGIKEYIDAYHTLGNFVLVPALFNGKRGLDKDICDFWDRSLNHLKNKGFDEFESGDFEQYVNYFFLWDYVDVAEDNKEYIPKTNLSEGLSSDISNGEIKQQYTDFFKKTTELIQRRGKFMAAMLMLPENDYQTLQSDIFNTGKTYQGFNDVVSLIEDKISLDRPVKDILDGLKD